VASSSVAARFFVTVGDLPFAFKMRSLPRFLRSGFDQRHSWSIGAVRLERRLHLRSLK
jgi:hypothetical protein